MKKLKSACAQLLMTAITGKPCNPCQLCCYQNDAWNWQNFGTSESTASFHCKDIEEQANREVVTHIAGYWFS